jgi:acyl dehydratase
VRDHRVQAYNTATASTNRIHDDVVAREYGFGGGLVPGVDVYAYMTHVPAEAWGWDWLARGTMRARFRAPVYDGDEIVVVAGAPVVAAGGDATVGLEVRNGAGELCATGEAGLPAEDVPAPPAARWPSGAQAAAPPVARPDVLAPGTALALAGRRFSADQAGDYLADVRETLPLYPDRRVAHPGWLLRDANYVLSRNVVLGPWIHVESVVQHHGPVADGEVVEARATVTREWEHKGHRFVELDVGLLADEARVAAHVRHTAIYRPRRPRGQG